MAPGLRIARIDSESKGVRRATRKLEPCQTYSSSVAHLTPEEEAEAIATAGHGTWFVQ
jgi:hypothetical protein